MTKQLFHYRLFKEGLRQTRLIGLISLTICVLFTALQWLIVFMNSINVDGGTKASIVPAYDLAPMILLVQYLICPLLTMYLFRYLNRRESSDFYHALPHTRTCLHLSYGASVMAWNLMITLSTFGVAAILYGFCCPSVVIQLSTVAPFLFNMLASQVLVLGVVLLAMSITGTTFSNLSVSVMILVFPRVFIIAAVSLVQTLCPIAEIENLSFFLDSSCNTVVGLPLDFISYLSYSSENMPESFVNVYSGLYTLCLGLLYLGAALWLLKRRKSETATRSAPSRLMQAVYRIALGTFIGLLPVSVLIQAFAENFYDVDTTLTLIVLGLVMATAYFLFELITTKKPKNMLRAIPGFFIVLALDAAIIGGVFALNAGVYAYQPTPDEITGISFLESTDNYFGQEAAQVVISDPDTVALACEALAETAEMGKKHGLYRYHDRLDASQFMTDFNSAKLMFRDKSGANHIRYVAMHPTDYEYMMSTLQKSQDFQAAYRTLPQSGGQTVVSLDYNLGVTGFEPTQSQVDDLYTMYAAEMTEIPFASCYAIASNSNASYYETNAGYFQVETVVGTDRYTLTLPITEDTPKTYHAYMQLYSQLSDGEKDRLTRLVEQSLESDTATYYEMSVSYPLEGYEWLHWTAQNPKDIQLLLDFIKTAPLYADQANQSMIQVQCYVYDDEVGVSGSCSVLLATDDVPDFMAESEETMKNVAYD